MTCSGSYAYHAGGAKERPAEAGLVIMQGSQPEVSVEASNRNLCHDTTLVREGDKSLVGVFGEISDGASEDERVVLGVPDHLVAVLAEKLPYFAGCVVVVDR